jgi:hypothetical protein
MFEESKSAVGPSAGGDDEGVSVEAVPVGNVLGFPPDVGKHRCNKIHKTAVSIWFGSRRLQPVAFGGRKKSRMSCRYQR